MAAGYWAFNRDDGARACEWCGEMFTPTNQKGPTSRFCCHTHRDRAWARRNAGDLPATLDLVCEWCSTPFVWCRTRGGFKPRFCCTSHREAARSRNRDRSSTRRTSGSGALPAGPLLAALSARGISPKRACMIAGFSAYRERGDGMLSVWLIDGIATKVLDTHPILIYGDDWLDLTAYQEGLEEVA